MSMIQPFNPGLRTMSSEPSVCWTPSLSVPPLQVKRSRDPWQRSPTTPTSMTQIRSLSSLTQTEGTILTSLMEEET